VPDRKEEEPRGLADHLQEYLREPMLWPVVLVAAAIFVTIGAATLLAGIVQRSLFAMAALALLGGMSADQVLRELRGGGPGVVTALVVGFWVLSGAVAFAVVRVGLF